MQCVTIPVSELTVKPGIVLYLVMIQLVNVLNYVPCLWLELYSPVLLKQKISTLKHVSKKFDANFMQNIKLLCKFLNNPLSKGN